MLMSTWLINDSNKGKRLESIDNSKRIQTYLLICSHKILSVLSSVFICEIGPV